MTPTKNAQAGAVQALLKKTEEVSGVLRSLAHPVRLKVLCQLMDREATVGELTEFCAISQSAMSQFLNRMRQEGLVDSRRDGTRIYYRITETKVRSLLRAVKEIYC